MANGRLLPMVIVGRNLTANVWTKHIFETDDVDQCLTRPNVIHFNPNVGDPFLLDVVSQELKVDKNGIGPHVSLNGAYQASKASLISGMPPIFLSMKVVRRPSITTRRMPAIWIMGSVWLSSSQSPWWAATRADVACPRPCRMV